MEAEGYLAISGELGEINVIGLPMHGIVNIWVVLFEWYSLFLQYS